MFPAVKKPGKWANQLGEQQVYTSSPPIPFFLALRVKCRLGSESLVHKLSVRVSWSEGLGVHVLS